MVHPFAQLTPVTPVSTPPAPSEANWNGTAGIAVAVARHFSCRVVQKNPPAAPFSAYPNCTTALFTGKPAGGVNFTGIGTKVLRSTVSDGGNGGIFAAIHSPDAPFTQSVSISVQRPSGIAFP